MGEANETEGTEPVLVAETRADFLVWSTWVESQALVAVKVGVTAGEAAEAE